MISSPAETGMSGARSAEGTDRPMRLLFAKRQLSFPRAQGHEIRAFNLMRALTDIGHQVGLATFETPSEAALRGLQLGYMTTTRERVQHESAPPMAPLTWPQQRYASYFGTNEQDIRGLGAAVSEFRPDVVVGLGPDILPCLIASGAPRAVWYVADEWVSHYGSLVRLKKPSTWWNIRTAVVWGLYERAFARSLERIWVVTERDARAMRRWAGTPHVDALPNGVDADYYAPQPVTERPRTAVFWGRLDFPPNLHALEWFCSEIWPALRARHSDAEFRIIGFHAGEQARALARIPGVELSSDLPDLRAAVCEHAVVVMPFKSGGGIKNKLLEGAGMARPIVCTPMACNGLRGTPAVIVASTVHEWTEAISGLWADAPQRQQLGARAREWVLDQHSWLRTAKDAAASVRRPPTE
jgi:glycosyltransferase involved in cell wall biosynthesis